MVCYIVPLAAALLLAASRKFRGPAGWDGAHALWLNIMMLGGAVFGLVDHAWNAELFLVNAAWMTDLALGGAITAGITACWGLVVMKPRIRHSMQHMSSGLSGGSEECN